MRVGALVPIGPTNADPAFVGRVGPILEQRGVESLWVPDHLVYYDDYSSSYPYTSDGRLPTGVDAARLDPLTLLTFVAATTSTLRLGSGVCVIAERNPVSVAKQVADLDVLSGGRVEFGVGVGWARAEYEALGVPFAQRGARTTDYIHLIKTLWTADPAEYQGRFVSLGRCRMNPKPTQQPHPPIVIGGESDGAFRRVAEVGDGWYSSNRRPDELRPALDRLAAALGERGRRVEDVAITVCPPSDSVSAAAIAQFEELGVHRLIVRLPAADAAELERLLDRVDVRSALIGQGV